MADSIFLLDSPDLNKIALWLNACDQRFELDRNSSAVSAVTVSPLKTHLESVHSVQLFPEVIDAIAQPVGHWFISRFT